MHKKSLAEYVQVVGQTETARRAGLSQGAIWQMLQSDRQIFVTELDNNTVTLEEIKPIRRNSVA